MDYILVCTVSEDEFENPRGELLPPNSTVFSSVEKASEWEQVWERPLGGEILHPNGRVRIVLHFSIDRYRLRTQWAISCILTVITLVPEKMRFERKEAENSRGHLVHLWVFFPLRQNYVYPPVKSINLLDLRHSCNLA